LKGATYDGDWWMGMIHGQGSLLTTSTQYVGNWNYMLQAGYGCIYESPGSAGKISGWTYDKLFTDKEAVIVENPDTAIPCFDGTEEDLFEIAQPEDRKFLVKYEGEKLFTEGEVVTDLYMLKEGN